MPLRILCTVGGSSNWQDSWLWTSQLGFKSLSPSSAAPFMGAAALFNPCLLLLVVGQQALLAFGHCLGQLLQRLDEDSKITVRYPAHHL